jgi:hypothetical protein
MPLQYKGTAVTAVKYNGQNVTKVYYKKDGTSTNVLVFDSTSGEESTEEPTGEVTVAPTVAPTDSPTGPVTEAPTNAPRAVTDFTLSFKEYSDHYGYTTLNVVGTFTGGTPSYWTLTYGQSGGQFVSVYNSSSGIVIVSPGTYTMYVSYFGTKVTKMFTVTSTGVQEI